MDCLLVCPELAFAFTSSRVLEPNLHHSLLEPDISRDRFQHLPTGIRLLLVLLIEEVELLRKDGRSQSFVPEAEQQLGFLSLCRLVHCPLSDFSMQGRNRG